MAIKLEMRSASEYIAGLEAEVERLRGALEAISELCAPLSRLTAGDNGAWENAIRQARAALELPSATEQLELDEANLELSNRMSKPAP
jgi:hypothetical protein